MKDPIVIERGVRNRFKEAIQIQQGACNPIAVSRALTLAIEQVRDERGSIEDDPAVRLIAHQLSFLLGVPKIDREFEVYTRLVHECEAKALVQPVREGV